MGLAYDEASPSNWLIKIIKYCCVSKVVYLCFMSLNHRHKLIGWWLSMSRKGFVTTHFSNYGHDSYHYYAHD